MAITTGTAIAMGALAAAGAAKNLQAQNQASKARNRQAEVARYSPWTGLTPQAVQDPGSMFGDIATGAASGASLGSALESTQAANANAKSLNDMRSAYTASLPTSNGAISQAAGSASPYMSSGGEMGARPPMLNYPGMPGMEDQLDPNKSPWMQMNQTKKPFGSF